MITLHKYGPAFGLPDISPFCIKVETYLRMTGVPFEAVISDVRKAPKQKLPYIDDGGTIVCDSRDIISYLETRVDAPLDRELPARDRALATAYRALIEEELYFYALYVRWLVDDNFRGYAPALRAYLRAIGVPRPLAPLLVRFVRKDVVRAAVAQGAGRHTLGEVEARACEGLSALSEQLGDNRYFLGDRPRVIDATVYAFVWMLLEAPFESRLRRHAQSLANLQAYTARMREAYFGPPALASGAREVALLAARSSA